MYLLIKLLIIFCIADIIFTILKTVFNGFADAFGIASMLMKGECDKTVLQKKVELETNRKKKERQSTIYKILNPLEYMTDSAIEKFKKGHRQKNEKKTK